MSEWIATARGLLLAERELVLWLRHLESIVPERRAGGWVPARARAVEQLKAVRREMDRPSPARGSLDRLGIRPAMVEQFGTAAIVGAPDPRQQRTEIIRKAVNGVASVIDGAAELDMSIACAALDASWGLASPIGFRGGSAWVAEPTFDRVRAAIDDDLVTHARSGTERSPYAPKSGNPASTKGARAAACVALAVLAGDASSVAVRRFAEASGVMARGAEKRRGRRRKPT